MEHNLAASIKKRILLLIVTAVFAAWNTGFAQTITGDSTYRPKAYQFKVDQFRADPVTKNDIVFLGNSITARIDWAKLLNDPRAKNRGISGDITFGVLERLDEVLTGKPQKIFILIGINDISRNIPDSIIIRNYKLIIARITVASPSTRIYFQTLLPVNSSFKKFPNHYHKDEHILVLNNAIRKLAGKKVSVIDLYPRFLNTDKKLKVEYSIDGLHLNAVGYQVWAGILKRGRYLK